MFASGVSVRLALH